MVHVMQPAAGNTSNFKILDMINDYKLYVQLESVMYSVLHARGGCCIAYLIKSLSAECVCRMAAAAYCYSSFYTACRVNGSG